MAWSMFLNAVRDHNAKERGISKEQSLIKLDYLPLDDEHMENAVHIRSITIDFEVGEILGIGGAFAKCCGGAQQSHITGLIRGCKVHYERALLQKACKITDPEQKEKFRKLAWELYYCTDVSRADECFAQIFAIDENWCLWLQKDCIRPLLCPAYSAMSPANRSLGLETTNTVESQNRVAHSVAGIQQTPEECIRKLHALDVIRTTEIRNSCRGKITPLKKTRKRSSSVLKPSSSERPRKRRQSKITRPPIKKKTVVAELKVVDPAIALLRSTAKKEWSDCARRGDSESRDRWSKVIQILEASDSVSSGESSLLVTSDGDNVFSSLVLRLLDVVSTKYIMHLMADHQGTGIATSSTFFTYI